MKSISIVIVTYDSERDIHDCVESIARFNDIPREEVELIIVDNNSREPQPMFKRLQEMWGDDIVTISNKQNGGYGQGNNIGIRAAKAPVILIMNPDVRLTMPILKTAKTAFEEQPKMSMYGMKQMVAENVKSLNSFACTSMMNGYVATILTAVCNRFDKYLPSIMYFSGSCFFVRKEMFLRVGLFDEDVFMYGEEDDIHYRLRKEYGNSMVYNPNLRYIHLTMERKPDLNYERKRLESALILHQKKGMSRKEIIANFMRNTNLLLWRCRIMRLLGKENMELTKMLQQFRHAMRTEY